MTELDAQRPSSKDAAVALVGEMTDAQLIEFTLDPDCWSAMPTAELAALADQAFEVMWQPDYCWSNLRVLNSAANELWSRHDAGDELATAWTIP